MRPNGNLYEGDNMKFIQIRILITFSGFLAILIFSLPGCNYDQNKPGGETQIKSKLNADAPWETEFLGKLVGMWKAKQSTLNPDGSWSENKSRAKWNWYYILEGHAIQDDWIKLDSLNNETIVGTNIRIYNTGEKRWYMAWIDKTNRRLASFTAVNESGTVIMDGTNAKGRHVRNTFFNITQNEFEWKQEWTFDEGKSWVEVARIHCERMIN